MTSLIASNGLNENFVSSFFFYNSIFCYLISLMSDRAGVKCGTVICCNLDGSRFLVGKADFSKVR